MKDLSKYISTTHKRMLAELIMDAGKIEEVQRAIVSNGTHISVDGDFGPQTATAIENSRMTPILATMYENIHGVDIPTDGTLPVWLNSGLGEIGVHEIKGGTHNKRVIEYMNATKWGTWVHDDETPWCAGFVGWCVVKAGLKEMVPPYSLGAKSWLKFGVSAGKPVLGAIAVKSRRGGGHVGFVVGESRGGKYLYILGGNQGDKVSVRKYLRSVWLDFRVPAGYKAPKKLTQWNGASSLAGSEA